MVSRAVSLQGATTLFPPNARHGVYFYNKGEPYYEFSNFYPDAPFSAEGKTWKTSEHFYQALKFENEDLRRRVHRCSCASEAKALANAHDASKRSEWDNVKDEVMLLAVYLKFSNNRRIKGILLSTGSNTIAENSPTDSYWGCNGTPGSNKLGDILLKVRTMLIALSDDE